MKYGEAQRCVPYLRQQSQISADLGNAEGRCRACSSLALALDSMSQPDKALAELNTVMTISEEVGDHYLQAQACRSLGTLYSKLGRLQEAVDTLQKHFQLTKKLLLKAPAAESGPATGSPTNKNAPRSNNSPDPQHTVTSHDLDIARAYIGISRGNLLLGQYCVALQGNLTALLDWKLNRTDIATSLKGDGNTTSAASAAVDVVASIDDSESVAS